MFHIAQINPFRSYFSKDKATVESFAKLFKVEVKQSEYLPGTAISIELFARPEVETYRKHLIVPVFNYSNGKSDFQVYGPDADFGKMYPSTTLEDIKAEINETENVEI